MTPPPRSIAEALEQSATRDIGELVFHVDVGEVRLFTADLVERARSRAARLLELDLPSSPLSLGSRR